MKKALALMLAVLAGLYGWQLAKVTWIAMNTGTQAGTEGTVVLLGKQSKGGIADTDFLQRIGRVQRLIETAPGRSLILSGGGSSKTEARVAAQVLSDRGVSRQWLLEEGSLTTRENLANTSAMTGKEQTLLVVTSRYHLARTRTLAQSMGLKFELIAAEDRWTWSLGSAGDLLREAAYGSAMALDWRDA